MSMEMQIFKKGALYSAATTVQIRNVPTDVHHQAKLAALLAGISLNQWLIEGIKKALETKND